MSTFHNEAHLLCVLICTQVEQIRRYLGGDAAHTVLVKGLDFALLEQQKAKVSATDAVEDEEALEAVFNNTSIPSSTPSESVPTSKAAGKKRTREELLKELKVKRAKGEVAAAPVIEDKALEEAKKVGKFKPIGSGFKPIAKTKDGRGLGGSVKKKKKRKVEEAVGSKDQVNPPEVVGEAVDGHTGIVATSERHDSKRTKSPGPEPEALPEDFDIFADAGEYEGLNIGDDDDDDSEKGVSDGEIREGRSSKDVAMRDAERREAEDIADAQRRKKWIEDEEDEDQVQIPASPPDLKGKGKEKSPPSSREDSVPARRSPTPEPARLAPLASSAFPSIRDILAADEALELEDKRKARKEKKKAGGGGGGEGKSVSKEAKLNRDYQKLKSYQEKKGRG